MSDQEGKVLLIVIASVVGATLFFLLFRCLRRRSRERYGDDKCISAGGVCKDVSLCKGTTQSGLCSGGVSNKCCFESAPSAPSAPSTLAGSSCTTDWYGIPGKCMGSDDRCGYQLDWDAKDEMCGGSAKCCIGLYSQAAVAPSAPSAPSAPASSDSCPLPHGTMMDAYSNGAKIGQVEVIKYQGKNVSRLLACAFQKMESAFGKTIKINSGFRSMDEQTYLYGCYKSKKCNNGNLAAKPGYSNHQNGTAVDVSTSGTYDWLAANAHKYGFIRTVKSEAWHWEYIPNSPRPTWY